VSILSYLIHYREGRKRKEGKRKRRGGSNKMRKREEGSFAE